MVKITWKSGIGEVYGEVVASESGKIAKTTLIDLLCTGGEWETFGEDGDKIIIEETE